MTREEGYYWVQLPHHKGDWMIGQWDGTYWSVAPYSGAKSSLYQAWEVKVVHCERIKEPDYQP